MAAAAAVVNDTNKELVLKKWAPFTDYITEISKTQVDDTQEIDIVMTIYNLIEYSDAHLKTSGSLWQYYRDEPALDNNNNIQISFKFKQQITWQTANGGTKKCFH